MSYKSAKFLLKHYFSKKFYAGVQKYVSRVVGVATGYGLDGKGIEFRWRRDIMHLSRPALGPKQLPVEWVLGLSRGKKRPEHDTDHSPHLVPWSRKSRAIPIIPLWTVQPVQSLSACTTVRFNLTYTSNPPMDRTACTEPQCLYNGVL